MPKLKNRTTGTLIERQNKDARYELIYNEAKNKYGLHMTKADVADYLGCSERTVFDWLKDVPTKPNGRKNYLTRDVVFKDIDERVGYERWGL